MRTCNLGMRFEWEIGNGMSFTNESMDVSPLQLAAKIGNVEIAELLLKSHAHADLGNAYFQTPLNEAAYKRHHKIVRLLLSYGANPNEVDLEGQSASMVAASRGSFECLEELVAGGADLNLMDDLGSNALVYAVGRVDIQVFAFILMTQGKLISDPDSARSPVSAALETDSSRLHSLILNAISNFSIFSAGNNNPLLSAAVSTQSELLKKILRRLPKDYITNLINSRDRNGNTALCEASARNSVEKISMLLAAGASLEVEGSEHRTPLMTACAMGRLAAVKILIAKGALISYVTTEGTIQNVWEAAKNHPKIRMWLVKGRFMEMPRMLTDRQSN